VVVPPAKDRGCGAGHDQSIRRRSGSVSRSSSGAWNGLDVEVEIEPTAARGHWRLSMICILMQITVPDVQISRSAGETRGVRRFVQIEGASVDPVMPGRCFGREIKRTLPSTSRSRAGLDTRP